MFIWLLLFDVQDHVESLGKLAMKREQKQQMKQMDELYGKYDNGGKTMTMQEPLMCQWYN